MNREAFIRNLRDNRFQVSFFPTAAEAVDYLCGQIQGQTVGLGDSMTLSEMGAAKRLAEHNTVIDPHPYSGEEFNEVAKKALTADIFLLSVNAAAETGELVNIDSSGNRVGGSIFGHRKVYFIFSENKVEPTLEKAIWRARNIAAPRNAQRFGFRTPCAVRGDRCYNCKSPDRICNVMAIHMKKEKSMDEEVILIGEPLGF
jgi:NAD-dependent dihydropyrimidine dehydrogenase PreA subunit